MFSKRPTEWTQAGLQSFLGAIVTLMQWAHNGMDLNTLADLAGPILIVTSFIAPITTYFVAKRQRAGEAVSNADGTVTPTPK